MLKKLKLSLVSILLAVLTLTSCGKEEVVPEEVKILPQVEVSQVSELGENKVATFKVGMVEADRYLEVRSEVSGLVENIFIEEGGYVQSGKPIIQVEHADTLHDLKSTQAQLQSARATLQKLRNGARNEEVQILELQLESAKEQLRKLQNGARREEIDITQTQLEGAIDTLDDLEIVYEQTVEKTHRDLDLLKQDSIFLLNSSQTSMERAMSLYLQDVVRDSRDPGDCKFRFVTTYRNEYGRLCTNAFNAMEEAQNETFNIATLSNVSEIERELIEMRDRLETAQTFIAVVMQALDSAVGGPNNTSINSGTLSTLKSSALSARGEIETNISQINTQFERISLQEINNTISITNAENSVNDQRRRIEQLQSELALKTSGARSEDLEMQRSQIRQIELQLEIERQGARQEDVQVQEAQISQIRAQLERQAEAVDDHTVRAPFKGRIISFDLDPGEFVQTGQSVATIADFETIEIITYVTEDEKSQLRVRDRIHYSLGENKVSGYVSEIAPSVDPLTKKVKITTIPVAYKHLFTIGSTIDIDFNLKNEGMLIPLTAVKFDGNDAYVLGIEGDTTTQMKIELGNIAGDQVEVLSGLTSEDVIVVDARTIQVNEKVSYK